MMTYTDLCLSIRDVLELTKKMRYTLLPPTAHIVCYFPSSNGIVSISHCKTLYGRMFTKGKGKGQGGLAQIMKAYRGCSSIALLSLNVDS
jgi:hypothetical protein